MNNTSKKTSNKSSRKNSPNRVLKTKSSTVGLRDDNTVDSELLKTNLQEFYKNSKEKLLKLKGEIESIETENENQKNENNQLNLKLLDLQNYNEELGLRLKGTKEKFINAQKHKSFLQNQIRDLKKEVEFTTRKMDTMKIDNSFKVKMIQNEIDHIHVIKENNIKSIKKKIENEEAYQTNLNEKIKEIREEIGKYKSLITELNEQDSVRTKELHKETADMTKFLSEL
jgi:chromosome segregation ATPase